jgi:hypothetical protein
MRDWLEIGKSIAATHEEAKRMFEEIWRAKHRAIRSIGSCVFDGLPDALFQIRRSNNLKVDVNRESRDSCGSSARRAPY